MKLAVRKTTFDENQSQDEKLAGIQLVLKRWDLVDVQALMKRCETCYDEPAMRPSSILTSSNPPSPCLRSGTGVVATVGVVGSVIKVSREERYRVSGFFRWLSANGFSRSVVETVRHNRGSAYVRRIKAIVIQDTCASIRSDTHQQ